VDDVLVTQVIRFILVGGFNAGLDLFLVNVAMWTTKIYKGKPLIFFNLASFSIVATSSFLLNHLWTFQSSQKYISEAAPFYLVTITGALINTAIFYFISTYVPRPRKIFKKAFPGKEKMAPKLWANFGKVTATGVSMVVNFVGYKLFVFGP
jgi:putative flippase GtrA